METRKVAGNVAVAFSAQLVTFMLSIVQNLLVPKVLGVEQYGYWQLFLFYQSYVGLFHFGLNDGVYLIHGGESRDRINKQSIKAQFFVGVIFQTLIGGMIFSLCLVDDISAYRKFILMGTAVFLVIQNAASYLGYIFQAMDETKRFSYSCILERLIFLVPLAYLLISKNKSFQPYVIAYIFSSICQLAYCCWHARDFFVQPPLSVNAAITDAINSVKVGIKLLIANIASMLVLGIARFSIDAIWGIETFGKLSFALSMVSFFMAFVSQAAMVLFPALRQSDPDAIRSFFKNALKSMDLVFPLAYLLYFPMVWVLGDFLPQYESSFTYFILLLPICVFDSKMNIACTTLYKVSRRESKLLQINIGTVLISSLFTLVGSLLAKNVFVIMCGAVAAIILRSIYSERDIAKSLGENLPRTVFANFLLTGIFIMSALLLPNFEAFGLCLVSYCLFLFANRGVVSRGITKIRSHKD